MAAQTEQPLAAEAVDQPTQVATRWLIALVFCGIALRLLLLIFRSEDLSTDPDAYVVLAENILEHGGLSQPGTGVPTAFRPPLYSWLLAALMWFGVNAPVVVAVVNLVSSAVVMIAAWWIARVVGLRGIWPALAAAFSGLDPLLLRYSVLPMTEVLSAALVSVAMLNVLKALPTDLNDDITSTNDDRTKSFIRAGVFFGLAGLCRPIAFVTCAVVCARLFVGCLPQRQTSLVYSQRLKWRTMFLLPIAATLILLPWVIRNAVHFAQFVPATTHGGYTLLLGNNEVFYREVVLAPGQPTWSGESLDRWQQQLHDDMLRDDVDQNSETDIDRWMYDRAKQTIASHPSAFWQACWLRWKRFWAITPEVSSGNLSGTLSVVAGVWFVVLWALLVPSLFCGIHRRRDIQMLWLAILSFLLIHTFYWTNARMRAPLTGIFAVLGTLGLRNVVHLIFTKRKP